MKDALGNKLEAGNLVLWNNMIAKVREVSDGGISIVDKSGGEGKAAPRIVLEIAIINPPANAVIRVVDPASESLVESAMGSA